MACAGIGAALAEGGGEALAGGATAGAGTGGLAAGFDLLGGETAVNAAASAGPLAGGAELGAAGAGASALSGGNGDPQFASEDSILDFSAPGAAPLGAQPAGGPGGSSFPSISQLGSGLNIASSLYGMDQASQLKKLALAQANKATPWQTAGGGDMAAQQLMALLSGKTDVSTLPGYGAGLQAVQRSGAANGWLGSGNMMAALQQYGGNFYNNAVSQLAGLSGANFNPVSAGSLTTSGATNSAALNLAAMSNINKTIETQPAWKT